MFELVALLVILLFVIGLFIVLPAQMASGRNRNPVVWVLISLVGSPLLAILLLLALGDAPINKLDASLIDD
ncbi:MAG: hypothetical protein ABJQ23_20010 [Shimia thalassica]|uniref:hypothetical protein n=1 Tax=Shimia thalassica TaxID=1715693 RepID=UPI003296FF5B